MAKTLRYCNRLTLWSLPGERRVYGLVAFFFMSAFLGFGAVAGAQDAATYPLSIRSGAVVHEFTVELAITQPERSKGLMFRRQMPADHGMLFDFETPRVITMWMRNTPLALDMVFADSDGVIIHIAKRSTPFSERTISSRSPARYVLEINGGRARGLGLKNGDQIEGLPIAPR